MDPVAIHGDRLLVPISMKITVELPDDVARHPDPGREALEALAMEGYRSEALSHHQAARLLGLTRFEFAAPEL
jgi:hypothetical protein